MVLYCVKYHFVESICYSTTPHKLKKGMTFEGTHYAVHTMLAEPSNPTTRKLAIHPSQNYRCEFLWWMEWFWRPLIPVSVASFLHINILIQPDNGLDSNWFQWFGFFSGGAWFGW